MLAEELQCLLIDGVDVGPFFAVNFYVDEEIVHETCDGVVFEAFVRHDVAPVTCGVADTQQDRFVVSGCFCEGVRAPDLPVHRIVLVLDKVGARGGVEDVAHGRVRVVGVEVECSELQSVDCAMEAANLLFRLPGSVRVAG